MTQKGVTVHSDHESNAWPRGGKSFCVESNTWLSNVLWGPNIQFLWFPCHNSTIRSNCAYVIVPISKKLLVIRSQLAWAKYCKNQFLKHVKIYVNNIKHHWWAICNTSSRSPHGPVNIHWRATSRSGPQLAHPCQNHYTTLSQFWCDTCWLNPCRCSITNVL